MNSVVVHAGDNRGLPGRDPRAQREQWLGPIQGLDLTLLIHGQDQGPIRRIKVEPHHIAQLLNKGGIGTELEGLDPMRLQLVGAFQMRSTVIRLSPCACAIVRTLQWVAWAASSST